MKSKILLRLILPVVVLGGFVFCMAFVFNANVKSLKADASPSLSRQEEMNPIVSLAGKPIRIKIPAIKVDASVEYMGLTLSGAMDIPKDPVGVAWFELGPRPGNIGSAVMAGHFGWVNDIPAVFDDLNKLKKGDKIYIEDDRGATVTFVVRELKIYGEKADARDIFISNDEKAHLNLITCSGAWNKKNDSYSNRLVVFADKE